MAERINADMDWTQYTRKFEMNLRRIRAQRGYSQERVAYDAGMSRLQYQPRGRWLIKRPSSESHGQNAHRLGHGTRRVHRRTAADTMARSAREVTEGNSQSCQFIARTTFPRSCYLRVTLQGCGNV